MKRSPLLDFRERRACYASAICGGMAVTAIAVTFMGTNSAGWSGALIAIPFVLAAKYAHSKLPVKRQRKPKAPEHPELFNDAFTKAD